MAALACSPPAVLRPSSQTTPTEPSAQGAIDTNPCSVSVPSRCGTTGSLQVRAPSRDRDSRTPYAYFPGPLLASQWAKSDPSPSEAIAGKSAQLTTQPEPAAIVRGADQAPLLASVA